ncbi:Phosphoserine phosphatase [Candidatus Methanobinarius endosymbioticus]|uniref:phosphoserine phosphatase n=1 Tax=Candidatus Methanobinarius endosymbioticus TaxID=2006182 RepID=A0A366M9H7_9EURY|nr:Phosphoserine phosphatase [Candidatus Methanobinarius endosymbioticus]
MIKLVVFDLDNVIIDGEAIDEIGKLVNVQKQIAEITEKTMNGDLDFETSIKERVKLLKGASVEEIKELGNEMKLMKGAEDTIKALKDNGYKVAVISGSFDLIAEPLKEKFNLDYLFTNTLEEKDGKLTGEVSGPLVDGFKSDVLNSIITDNDMSVDECIAVGDGANDISMMEIAQLGIAFNAKTAVKEVADIIVENKDLNEVFNVINDLDYDSTSEKSDDSSKETDKETSEEEKSEKSVEKDTVVEEKEGSETENSKEISDKSSKPKGKKSKKDSLPEVDFDLAPTPEGVKKQKDEKEEVIAKIADEREEFNKVAKEQRKIRDKLNDSLKENLKLAIELRDKRNEVNKTVEEAKKLRDDVNEDLKKLEWSSGRRDRIKLETEIKKIDKIIETRVLDIKKENQLVKNANDLRKQLMEIQEDEKVKDEAQDLKKVSEEQHVKVVELSTQAQEFHENMLNYFRKTDDIRTEADEAHKKFIEAKKAASSKHEEFKIVLSEIHIINKELGTNKSKRRKSEKQASTKKNREEKEKAEDIFEKFKHGKKLTTEELLLLQKHNIG